MIREETTADIPAIRNVVLAAFGQADEADLVEALRQSGDSVLSLINEQDDEIIGHILFSKLQAPGSCLALAPVCVSPEKQNKGIGSKLIEQGLARAKSDGWQGVFVLGEPDYYRRFGFSIEMADKFETPYPKPYFMALELVPGALGARSGKIIYAAPFLDMR